jgi:ABC-type branched-subunit amino acid transport system ATPase component
MVAEPALPSAAASAVASDVSVARPRIHIRDAQKRFDGRVVVHVDELTLGERPIEGLIGPNGAGKTTLMRMVMHSLPLDRGTITLRRPDLPDVHLSSLPAHRMAGLGVVKSNQVVTDFPKLTVLDSLLLAVAEARYEQPHRVLAERALFLRHEEEVRHHLDAFGFDDPTVFARSAGEKKLLDIVRCLLLRPRFLLLDEPTAGLPVDVTAKVMAAVRDLAASGTSVVIVEHDLAVIWGLCDWVHFMAEGDVVLQGDPKSIREHHVVVEKYLGEGHV